MADIVMPRLSDTMEEGTILRWLKADGEHVNRGEDLVEIETDKATMNYQSDQEGVLRTLIGEGETVPVGTRIAWVGAEQETAANDGRATEASRDAGEAETPPGTHATETSPGTQAIETSQGASATGGPPTAAAPTAAAPTAASPPARAPDERVKASPLARRLARARGVEIDTIAGTGPAGRIVRADVDAAVAAGASGEALPLPAEAAAHAHTHAAVLGAPATAPAALAGAQTLDVSALKGDTTVLEGTRMQRAIARRMAESKATIPDFTLSMDVEMEACVRLRAELKRLFATASASTAGGAPAPAPTFNDMVIKASALALREHPRVNASYRDGSLRLHSRINVGVAVATEDGLVVPTIFDAEVKSLGEISMQARALADRVRAATITPPELAGGTFTVSNLGMFGVDRFTAIINPPQVVILAVGSVTQRAVVRDGALVARHMTALTLVCDHRALYGADAARFLARVAELLESPAALTL
jgi:pyruvate dehydrogenase E2 component (dihydrolipoamide acetyltransferase)